jgi:hypothetical protein
MFLPLILISIILGVTVIFLVVSYCDVLAVIITSPVLIPVTFPSRTVAIVLSLLVQIISSSYVISVVRFI